MCALAAMAHGWPCFVLHNSLKFLIDGILRAVPVQKSMFWEYSGNDRLNVDLLLFFIKQYIPFIYIKHVSQL